MRSPFINTFTYTLGKSLYIPLTSRCNTLTLPQTRGPNFLLPNAVVASLLRVRQAEELVKENQNIQILDNNLEGKSRLSPPEFPKLVTNEQNLTDFDDQSISPTADVLLAEIKKLLSASDEIQSIVFAGEGEPTLRLKTLLHLSQQIRNDANFASDKPIRIVTNGLILASENEGNRRKILEDLKVTGIDELSVALMTSCSTQYDDLMQPCWDDEKGNKGSNISAHERICSFIRDAIDVGLSIECTGVEHSYIDMGLAEKLGGELGASSFRWRPYFP